MLYGQLGQLGERGFHPHSLLKTLPQWTVQVCLRVYRFAESCSLVTGTLKCFTSNMFFGKHEKSHNVSPPSSTGTPLLNEECALILQHGTELLFTIIFRVTVQKRKEAKFLWERIGIARNFTQAIGTGRTLTFKHEQRNNSWNFIFSVAFSITFRDNYRSYISIAVLGNSRTNSVR